MLEQSCVITSYLSSYLLQRDDGLQGNLPPLLLAPAACCESPRKTCMSAPALWLPAVPVLPFPHCVLQGKPSASEQICVLIKAGGGTCT